MILTTTSSIDGKKIEQYLGLVTGETIIGANLFRDLFAGITDIIGGRSGAYEQVLAEARETAIKEMSEKAANLGANGIVGIDLDYETVGTGNMLMVVATGTAIYYV